MYILQFPNILTYVGEYYFQKLLNVFVSYINFETLNRSLPFFIYLTILKLY